MHRPSREGGRDPPSPGRLPGCFLPQVERDWKRPGTGARSPPAGRKRRRERPRASPPAIPRYAGRPRGCRRERRSGTDAPEPAGARGARRPRPLRRRPRPGRRARPPAPPRRRSVAAVDPAAEAELFAMPDIAEDRRVAFALAEAGELGEAAAILDALAGRHPGLGALHADRAALALSPATQARRGPRSSPPPTPASPTSPRCSPSRSSRRSPATRRWRPAPPTRRRRRRRRSRRR